GPACFVAASLRSERSDTVSAIAPLPLLCSRSPLAFSARVRRGRRPAALARHEIVPCATPPRCTSHLTATGRACAVTAEAQAMRVTIKMPSRSPLVLPTHLYLDAHDIAYWCYADDILTDEVRRNCMITESLREVIEAVAALSPEEQDRVAAAMRLVLKQPPVTSD